MALLAVRRPFLGFFVAGDARAVHPVLRQGALVAAGALLDPVVIEAQLEQLKALTPHAQQLIIVHTQTQQQRVQSTGLLALLAGFTAEDLFASIFV